MNAIAYLLHLLTFLGQVVEGLQVLQPNGVLTIPELYIVAEIIYLAYNAPVAALAPEFRIILG